MQGPLRLPPPACMPAGTHQLDADLLPRQQVCPCRQANKREGMGLQPHGEGAESSGRQQRRKAGAPHRCRCRQSCPTRSSGPAGTCPAAGDREEARGGVEDARTDATLRVRRRRPLCEAAAAAGGAALARWRRPGRSGAVPGPHRGRLAGLGRAGRARWGGQSCTACSPISLQAAPAPPAPHPAPATTHGDADVHRGAWRAAGCALAALLPALAPHRACRLPVLPGPPSRRRCTGRARAAAGPLFACASVRHLRALCCEGERPAADKLVRGQQPT